MMQLPELNAEERAALHSGLPDAGLQSLAERLRQGLVVSLGQKVAVSCLPVKTAPGLSEHGGPVIRMEPELAAAWLAMRYGGKTEAGYWPVRDAALLKPFQILVRRALAHAVINLGDNAAWPQVMCLQITIGLHQGRLEIIWDGRRAMSWARREIGGER